MAQQMLSQKNEEALNVQLCASYAGSLIGTDKADVIMWLTDVNVSRRQLPTGPKVYSDELSLWHTNTLYETRSDKHNC